MIRVYVVRKRFKGVHGRIGGFTSAMYIVSTYLSLFMVWLRSVFSFMSMLLSCGKASNMLTTLMGTKLSTTSAPKLIPLA